MSLKSVNTVEKNKVELEISIDKAAFDKAVNDTYHKQVGRMNVPGFRRGKAPKMIIEKMYGKGVFYDDAINSLLPDAFEEALKESKADMVGKPEFDVVSIDDEGVVIKATFFVKPEVEVKDYKGLKADRILEPTTDDQINQEIERIRQRNSRTIDITDRAVQSGDIAVIDYEGFTDGVAFAGGKAENHHLTIGSGQFIPGFEDQIIGHSTGDEFDVNVTFPEEYHAEDLKGKPAVFKVKLNKIEFNELPELDDEFAKDVSEFDTFAEYKDSIKAKIDEAHAKEADANLEDKLIDLMLENLTADIPQVMIEDEIDQCIRDFATRLSMQGLDFNTYLQYTGMNVEMMRAQFTVKAEKQVKTRLALEKIADEENIEVTSEDIENEFNTIASMYGVEVDKIKEQITEDMLSADIKVRKAAEIIKTSAVVTEKLSTDVEAKEEKPKKTTTKKTTTSKKTSAEKTATAEKKTTTAKKTTAKKAAAKDEGSEA